MASLPTEHQALKVWTTDSPIAVVSVPTPRAGPGSVVIQVLSAIIYPYSGEVYNGKRGYPLPTPFVPGEQAIGRVVDIGPDTTTLSCGSLVLFNAMILGRDNPSALYISGIMEGFSDESRKLSRGEWRDSTYAEYTKVPLENCLRINESRIADLGYSLDALSCMFPMFVPFGGLSDIDVRAGETVIVAPATGKYGGAAVHVALAMGARVVAMGRSKQALSELAALDSKRVVTVPITNHYEVDRQALLKANYGEPVDAYLDLSPPSAGTSTHLRTCFDSVKPGGRISFMGAIQDQAHINYGEVTARALTVKATWRCSPAQAAMLLKMVEAGTLSLDEERGLKIVEKYKLDNWNEAFETAAKHPGPGQIVIFSP